MHFKKNTITIYLFIIYQYLKPFSYIITKVKPNITSIEVHPQVNNNKHLMDGALVDVSSMWPGKNI
jgi:hypothetical protein